MRVLIHVTHSYWWLAMFVDWTCKCPISWNKSLGHFIQEGAPAWLHWKQVSIPLTLYYQGPIYKETIWLAICAIAPCCLLSLFGTSMSIAENCTATHRSNINVVIAPKKETNRPPQGGKTWGVLRRSRRMNNVNRRKTVRQNSPARVSSWLSFLGAEVR